MVVGFEVVVAEEVGHCCLCELVGIEDEDVSLRGRSLCGREVGRGEVEVWDSPPQQTPYAQ